MRLTSTFHGLTAISSQIAPVRNSHGINYVLSNTIALHSYLTITGVNFLVVSKPDYEDCEDLLDEIYLLFANYVMKNPFYELDMPIRCSLFEENLDKLIASQCPFCEQTESPLAKFHIPQ